MSNPYNIVYLFLVPIAPTIHEMVNAPTYDYDVLRGQGFLRGAVGNKNISAYPGTEVHIDCPAGGFPQPKIFWSKDGERLHPDGEFVKVTGNGTLVLPHLTRDMQGTYECFAVNVGGGSSRSINVKVTGKFLSKDFLLNVLLYCFLLCIVFRLQLVSASERVFRPNGSQLFHYNSLLFLCVSAPSQKKRFQSSKF